MAAFGNASGNLPHREDWAGFRGLISLMRTRAMRYIRENPRLPVWRNPSDNRAVPVLQQRYENRMPKDSIRDRPRPSHAFR